jgi:hypothetical protein
LGKNGQRLATKKINYGRMLVKVKRQMKKRQIIQPILWTKQPIGAIMGVGSL